MIGQTLFYAALALPPLAFLGFAYLSQRKVQKSADNIDRMRADLVAKRQTERAVERSASNR